MSSAFCFLFLWSVRFFFLFFLPNQQKNSLSESDSKKSSRTTFFCAKPSQRIRRTNSLRKRHNYTQKTRIKMSALTSSFTANLVSVKSAAKKSQKVVVGVQASNEFAKKVRKFLRLFLLISFVLIARRSVVRIRSREWKNENVRIDLNKSDVELRFPRVRVEFRFYFSIRLGRFHSPNFSLSTFINRSSGTLFLAFLLFFVEKLKKNRASPSSPRLSSRCKRPRRWR